MIAHFCVGLSILMKGVDKLEHPGKELFAILLILVGLVIFIGTFYHKKLEPFIGNFKLYLFGLESFVMGLLGYNYMIGGSKLMFYFYYLVSFLFLVAILIHIFILPRRKEKEKIETNGDNSSKGEVNSIDLQEEKN